jgi:hypothetical protein
MYSLCELLMGSWVIGDLVNSKFLVEFILRVRTKVQVIAQTTAEFDCVGVGSCVRNALYHALCDILPHPVQWDWQEVRPGSPRCYVYALQDPQFETLTVRVDSVDVKRGRFCKHNYADHFGVHKNCFGLEHYEVIDQFVVALNRILWCT